MGNDNKTNVQKKAEKQPLGKIKNIFKPAAKPEAETHVNGSERILNKYTDFDTSETYKSIRTNIMFSMPKTDEGKVIAVVSASPGEGKTTTCTNLAITFSQTGAKTILIDCDLRRARVHRYLQLQRKDGVSNILCGFVELEPTIKRNVRENLDVLTAGDIPPNPAELLESKEFGIMLDALKKQYDYIFIDTPPITLVTDAAVMIKECNSVVLTVRQDYSSYPLLDAAVECIKQSGTKLLGVVFTGCENKAKKYGYYRRGRYGGYGKRYGYRYGYKYGYRYGYGYKYGYGYGYGYGDRYERSKKQKEQKRETGTEQNQ